MMIPNMAMKIRISKLFGKKKVENDGLSSALNIHMERVNEAKMYELLCQDSILREVYSRCIWRKQGEKPTGEFNVMFLQECCTKPFLGYENVI